MNRDWEIVNVFLTHNSPDDVYQAWLRIRAEQGESPVTVRAKRPVQQTNGKITPHICAKIERCHLAGGKHCGSHQPCYTV